MRELPAIGWVGVLISPFVFVAVIVLVAWMTQCTPSSPEIRIGHVLVAGCDAN
jgi:hypothetical protein